MILDGKSLQEYPVNAGVLEGSTLGPTLSYYTLMTFQTILSMILLSLLMILLSKCDQTSDLWQQLELASELESDLRDTVDWGKKWLVDFNAEKTQLVLFDRSYNNSSIDVEMDGSVVEEKPSFKMLGLPFSSKLDWDSYIISIANSASKKIGALIRSVSFVLLRLLCISINLS